jgi:hypothetical protein
MSSPWAGGGSRPILLARREVVEPTPNLVDFDNESQYLYARFKEVSAARLPLPSNL